MQAWDPELHFTKLKIQSCIKPRQNQTKPKTTNPKNRVYATRFTQLTYKVTLHTSVFDKTFNGTCNYNHKGTCTT